MRSRFAAFARREVAYLWKTLHPAHPLRAQSEPVVLASLRRAVDERRYQSLTLLDATVPDGDGVAWVLFHAGVFVKGQDVGFTECSAFAHDGVGWRYLRGVAVSRTDAHTVEAFRARHPSEGA
jgi:SEC-C motif-containing protein